MGVQIQRMTVEEFERFAALPENEIQLLEYIGGETVEGVCNSYSSLVAANILFLIKLYLRESSVEAYVTGEAAGYNEALHETWIPYPPDLVVEVLSPTDKPKDVSAKVANYLAVGTTVWLVDPEDKVIKVCVPGQKVQTVRSDDQLDGDHVLPGFSAAVKDIFQV